MEAKEDAEDDDDEKQQQEEGVEDELTLVRCCQLCPELQDMHTVERPSWRILP